MEDTESLRIKNYMKQLDTDEDRVEQFIAKCEASQDPQRIIDVVNKIEEHIDMPLDQLEDHIS